jgi:hypothetical protein
MSTRSFTRLLDESWQSVSVQLLSKLLFFRNCHKHGRGEAGKVEPISSLYQLRRMRDGIADPDVQMELCEYSSRD